jgi:capsular polysaccharide biosynthesis protein
MTQQAPDLRRSIWIIRRHGALVGTAIAVGLLAGAIFAAFSPVMVTSTARVMLPQSDVATAVMIARSDPVLAGALLRGSPAASLEALRGEVQVKSLTGDVLSVSARARTAAQAETTANTVADSYIGYISSPGTSAVRVQEQLLEPATTATGLVPPVQVLVGAVLGLISGALTGVIGALASR